ncbi:MAG: 50S ribosomal protein L24 [Clostridia bacterium]
MNKMNIKTNDTVVIIAGKDKGKKGKVVNAYPAKNRVVVEGANMATVHVSPQKSGGKESGIVRREAALHVSNVMRICPKCDEPTRIAHKILEDGTKSRICKKCGETI